MRAALTAILSVAFSVLLASEAKAEFRSGDGVTVQSLFEGCVVQRNNQYPTTIELVDVTLSANSKNEHSLWCYWEMPNSSIVSTNGRQDCNWNEMADMGRADGCSGEEVQFPECVASVGNPIDLASGVKRESVTDFMTAGPRPFGLVRHYSSAAGLDSGSRMGAGWATNFDRRLEYCCSGSNQIRIWRPDGTRVTFYWYSSQSAWVPSYFRASFGGYWRGRDDVTATLEEVSGNYVFTDENDVVETYDSNGNILTVEDRSGYTITYSYDTNGLNNEVSDSFGRTIEFSYNNAGLLTGVTDPQGRSYSYAYEAPYAAPSGLDPNGLFDERGILVEVTYPDDTPSNPNDNPTVEYHYTDADHPFGLTGITDERGILYASWGYDSEQRAIFSEHNGGNDRYDIAYDYANDEVVVTNPHGRDTTYSFTDYFELRRVSAIEGEATANCALSNATYQYNSDGFLNRTVDAEGSITLMTVNSFGLPTQIDEADGLTEERQTSVTWNSTYRLPTQIVEPGLTTNISYNSSGLPTSFTDTDTTSHSTPYSTNGQTRTTTITYASYDLIDTIDGPLTGAGDTVDFDYSASGYLVEITNEVGHVTQITTHTGMGYPTTIIDPNGITTTIDYDARDRITAITVNPGANQARTEFSYDGRGNVTQVIAANGVTLDYTYDNASRLTSIENSAGERVEMTLDDMGAATAIVIRDGSNVIQYQHTQTFDDIGRILSQIGSSQSQTTQFGYDRVDNLTEIVDPMSGQVDYSFDGLNRLVSIADQLNADTGIDYADAGDHLAVVAVTDARSNATDFVVNGWGEIIEEDSPDRGTIVYIRDSRGLITQETDARGQVVNFTYDDAGRLLTRSYVGASAQNVTFTWDTGGDEGVGRITTVDDATGSTDYFYGALGHRYKESRTVGSVTYDTIYAYDEAGLLEAIEYPSDRQIAFIRDADGRVTRIDMRENSLATWSTVMAGMTYEPFGPLSGGTYGNSRVLAVSFNSDYQMTGIAVSGGVLDLDYSFNLAGEITSIADSIYPARNESYGYSAVGRLTDANGGYGDIDYSYDLVGNRTGRDITIGGTTTSESYIYPSSSNRLDRIQIGGVDQRIFGYLSSGHVSSDNRVGVGNYTYAYDAAGRVATVSLGGTPQANYTYDADGLRIVSQSGSSTTHRVFGPDGALLAESDGSGNVLREYVWLGLMPLAMIDHTGSGSAVYFLHADHSGRPVRATNTSGTVAWDGQFTPFGETVAIATSLSLELRFPGQYRDAASDLNYNWTRYYDPALGRYMRPDSIGLDGGINLYAYVNGNPVSLVDPNGEFAWFVPLLIGALIGGGSDLVIQLIEHDGDFRCVDRGRVALSAVLGGALGSTGPGGILFGHGGRNAFNNGFLRRAGIFNRGTPGQSHRVGWGWNGPRDRVTFGYKPPITNRRHRHAGRREIPSFSRAGRDNIPFGLIGGALGATTSIATDAGLDMFNEQRCRC